MSLQLKIYQQDCLTKLDDFLRRTVETASPTDTFFEQTHRTYLPIPGLTNLPYICLRVPTGGGKTILAAYAIPLISQRLLRQDRSLVLWLAPTNTIVEQTTAALKNRNHPYRQALDAACGGNVSIFTAPEALYLSRSTLDSDTTVIVSTLAALRVTDTEGRKIYEANGALMPHFTGLSDSQRAELITLNESASESSDATLAAPSLANVIRLRHPIVIMDEAHNARTPLSFDTLQRFAPSCILELTATPSTDHNPKKQLFASNVLHSVSALELKEEQMIKLPIKVRCRPQWKEAVQDAVTRRNSLEDLAVKEQNATGEYIRPIVLFQAQNDTDDPSAITPDKLKQTLIADFNIPEDQIAIATGTKDELSKIKNLLTPESPIRYIATIQKLKEGWDCPFAYVLCTLTNISGRTAVEQFLGRILRLPQAKRKMHDALNNAYAYVTSQETHSTTMTLTELLEEKAGFSKFDASVAIVEEPTSNTLGPLFDEVAAVTLQQTPDLAPIPIDLQAKLTYEPKEKILAWTNAIPMTDGQLAVLEKCVKTPVDRQAVKELCQKTRGKSLAPAAQGLLFSVPQIAVRENNRTSLFEDQFRETPWDLAKDDPILAESDFVLPNANIQTAVIDVAQTGKLQANFITELQQQLALFDRGFQTLPELVAWMARATPAPDVPPSQMDVFLRNLVKGLIDLRGYTIEQLVSARFQLLDAAARRIDHHRRAALNESFQLFLNPAGPAVLEVSANICFEFPMRSAYPAPSIYTGNIAFKKHYYQNIAAMNAEEARCAEAIDSHAKVKFWVRNLVRHDFAFWLPTSTDRFYPDFVALLSDGRYLAIEYKGEHLESTDDTQEKLQIGQLWEARSNSQCLFRLVTKSNYSQLISAI